MVRSRLEMNIDILDAIRTRHVKNRILIGANINSDDFQQFEDTLVKSGLMEIRDGARFRQYHLTVEGRRFLRIWQRMHRSIPNYRKLPLPKRLAREA